MNRTHVQAYYANNKDTVYFRKAMKRCREHGTMPQIQAAVQHKLPLTALLVAFGISRKDLDLVHRVRRAHQVVPLLELQMCSSSSDDAKKSSSVILEASMVRLKRCALVSSS